MYQLQLEKFSGPIEKLLELIERKKLEITELNLADATADFLNYVKRIENIEPRLLADFVVIAAKLLLIKSKALLPNLQLTEEEEKDIKDLENRLKIYRQFKPAIDHLKELSERNGVSISQPLFSRRPIIFYPSENIKIGELHKAIKGIFDNFKQFQNETKIIKSSLITLEEKIEEIINRLNADSRRLDADSRGKIGFDELIRGKPRSEIIVLFLALLHLLAKQSIRVEQKEKFSDIIITKQP
ncbi:MAG: segregation/condensation protein A [bacterium]|nr:segregation/condensation protein A [bacterium]